jgi:hypothetical protein
VPRVLTPRCPVCDSPPVMVFGGGTQAFCGNDDCSTVTWNPAESLDDNLLDVHFVELRSPGNLTDDPQAAQ